MNDLPELLLISGCDADEALMEEASAELRRLYELEAAVVAHRMAVGQAYGIGSFKTQHAANMELWKHVRPAFVTASTENTESTDEAGLARPAMMEDDE